jgi:succinate dehydrogenase / fumarate reductase flavoprotein subunit
VTGAIESHAADAVCLCSGGYANVFFLSTNSVNSSVNAVFRAYRRGAFFANPCFTQIHPTCIPVTGEHQAKLTLMSESLRNDGRVWVPKQKGDARPPGQIPEGERDYFLERKYPSYGNLAARDVSSRAAKEVCDDGRGVGPGGRGVYLDFADAIGRQGVETIKERYGNLFEMYERITAENAYQQPMRIYPAPHYTMGGLWVDYNLESNIRGLFVLGEANYSDHGANRLGASGLMQGLADGYFILPYTIADYLSGTKPGSAATTLPEFTQSCGEVASFTKKLMSVQGRKTPAEFHRELGKLMWDHVGMARSEAALKVALRRIPEIRDEFWKNVLVAGNGMDLNQELERAGRVADFLEFAELLTRDALNRDESCGAHFRIEHQTGDGEAVRNDKDFCYVSAWQYKGDGKEPEMHKEPLSFEHAHLAVRSYK